MSPLTRYTPGFAVALGLTLVAGSALWHVKPGTSTPSTQKTIESSVKVPNPTRSGAKAHAIASYGKLPLSFEVNRGQTGKQVKFLTRGPGYALFLTSHDAVLSVSSQKSEVGSTKGENRELSLLNRPSSATTGKGRKTTDVVRMKLINASQAAEPTGVSELPGKVNYFVGNDPSKWRTNIPTYAKVRYKNIYPGIDLVYYGNQGQLEYDFVVAPGANPGQIALTFEGSTGRQHLASLQIDKAGDVLIQSGSSVARLKKPVIYQPKSFDAGAKSRFSAQDSKSVDGRFVLTASNHIHFELGLYDKSRPLVIDPALTYSTFLGGTMSNSTASSHGVGAVDSSGNAFIAGLALGGGFPTTSGVFEPTPPDAGGDVFVTKIDPTGSRLVWSTYFGGPAGGPSICGENGPFLALDSAESVYITGYTTSTTFPVMPPNAFQTKLGNPQGCNAFVTKLNKTGSALVYSTYLGGTNGLDIGRGIAVDTSGDAYVAGSASSTDFPTKNAIQSMYGGGSSDAFLTEVNPTGTDLVFSTFLGGTGNDNAASLAIDGSGAIYVSGDTGSTDFPTKSPLQATLKGTSNAFLAKVAPGGSTLDYSTYLGGSGSDFALSLVVDSLKNAYVGGETSSADFPTVSAFQSACPSNDCVFATKINSAGSGIVYSTYLGGSGSGRQFGGVFAVDGSGNAYLSGTTFSPDFPLQNPIQTTYGGNGDAFVTVLDPAGLALVFSTYLGGSQRDRVGNGDFGGLDSAGRIYIGGETESTDYPVTSGALQTSFSGGSAAFISKIDLSAKAPPSYSLSAGTPTQTTINPGGSSQTTVTVASHGGYTGTVTLLCNIAPAVSPAPTCSFGSTSPVNVTTSGGTATLTFNTVGPSAAVAHSSALYALLLPIPGLALIGVGFGSRGSGKNRLLGCLLVWFVLAMVITTPACGGGSNNGGGGGGGGSKGTPAGAYTVTITGKDANGTAQSNAAPSVTITVN